MKLNAVPAVAGFCPNKPELCVFCPNEKPVLAAGAAAAVPKPVVAVAGFVPNRPPPPPACDE